jgi:membrane protein YdbS with pleckstrin-like domain
MKYDWSQVLTPEEKIITQFSISNKYLSINLAALIILAVILVLFTIIFPEYFIFLVCASIISVMFGFVIYSFYLPASEQYALTDKRIVAKQGFFNTNLITVDYDKITDIKVNEYFFSKLVYGCGDLIINTAGSTISEIVMLNIDAPQQIRTQILQLADKIKK